MRIFWKKAVEIAARSGRSVGLRPLGALLSDPYAVTPATVTALCRVRF